ncbi:MAG: hypothetical protein PUC68_01330 [Firmicutes bacterium]|nr:hypothetical protein [Bacillota bacterium]
MTKDQFEGCLEVLDRVNMLGTIEGMDDDLKNDIIESFISCQNLFLYELNKRPVVKYSDDKRELYMYCDSFRELNDEEINLLNNMN